MSEVNVKMTVYFEEPFWIAVIERNEEQRLSVAKVTFGTEPKDYVVYEYIVNHFYHLRFGKEVEAEVKDYKKNPKRMQRDVKKQLENKGIGTKSQQALKLQHEQNKMERKSKSREQKLEKMERLFSMKQQKKKEKHKGR